MLNHYFLLETGMPDFADFLAHAKREMQTQFKKISVNEAKNV